MKIKNLAVISFLILSSCGNVSEDNEMIGQAKKIHNMTPLICSNFVSFDVSLGVMANGTGSISNQDVWLTVDNLGTLETIKRAVEKGSIVRIKYYSKRIAFCTDTYHLTSIEVL